MGRATLLITQPVDNFTRFTIDLYIARMYYKTVTINERKQLCMRYDIIKRVKNGYLGSFRVRGI